MTSYTLYAIEEMSSTYNVVLWPCILAGSGNFAYKMLHISSQNHYQA